MTSSVVRDLTNIHRRDDLANTVIGLLRADFRVREVSLTGSLADGRADGYSDIDVVVRIDGISDRAFAELVPDFLRSIGPTLIEGWGLNALPEEYVRTIHFTDYPLFWRVDVRCESEHHIDGSDLKAAWHWPQIFKVWLQELVAVLRGAASIDGIDRIVARWPGERGLPQDVKARLSMYLDVAYERAKSRGAPCDEYFARCDAHRREYLL